MFREGEIVRVETGYCEKEEHKFSDLIVVKSLGFFFYVTTLDGNNGYWYSDFKLRAKGIDWNIGG
jgi:uncharacterized protein (UPF0128 family)